MRHKQQHIVSESLICDDDVSGTGPTTPLLSENEDPSTRDAADPSSNPRFYRRIASSFIVPFTDQTGSASNIIAGLLSIIFVGSFIGILAPKDESLGPIYRYVSSTIGYIYFACWSVSFWPQVILNFKRTSTAGLSNEFSVLNLFGFACYATYTCCLFFSSAIQKMYKDRNGPDAEITVQSNDVAFAVHALILCLIQVIQIWWYKGFESQGVSMPVKAGLVVLIFFCGIYGTLVACGISGLNWLDYLYALSFVKIIISLVKYCPQVILNYNRKSTIGWNIWNIILDFTGGTLSIGQQVGDAANLHDFTGITGNPAKFALGFVSIFFDVIFFVQHYVLYRETGLVHDEGDDDDDDYEEEDEAAAPLFVVEEDGEESNKNDEEAQGE